MRAQLGQAGHGVPELGPAGEGVLDEGEPPARPALARESRADAVERRAALLARPLVEVLAIELGFPGLEQRDERLHRPGVVGLAEVGERLLREEGGVAGAGEARHRVDLALDGVARGPGDEAQQVDPVAAAEVARRRLQRSLEPGPRQRAARVALDDQEVEQEAPPVAPLLGLELVEQAGRAEAGPEEGHHRLQLRVTVGPVHVLAQPLLVERLVPLPEDGLHEAGLHLLLGGELRGQLEHLHRAAEVALVELLGGGAHQVAVAAGHLDRVLGQGDDLLHRLDLARGAEVGGVGHDLLRHRPVRELPPEAAEDLLGAGLDARAAEAAQVVLELLLALRLGGGGGDRLRHHPPARALGRRPLADALLAQALLEEREPPQAGRRGGGSRLGRRGLRGASHHLDRAGAPHLRLAEVRQRAAEAVAVGARLAGLGERRAHAAQEDQQPLAIHEVELADHAELVQRVEEQVHEGQVGLHRLLPLRPAQQLGRPALDRCLEEHGHGVGDHERRDAVGQVLVDLLEGRAQVERCVGQGREGGAEARAPASGRRRRRRARRRPRPRLRRPTPRAGPGASPSRPRSGPRAPSRGRVSPPPRGRAAGREPGRRGAPGRGGRPRRAPPGSRDR